MKYGFVVLDKEMVFDETKEVSADDLTTNMVSHLSAHEGNVQESNLLVVDSHEKALDIANEPDDEKLSNEGFAIFSVEYDDKIRGESGAHETSYKDGHSVDGTLVLFKHLTFTEARVSHFCENYKEQEALALAWKGSDILNLNLARVPEEQSSSSEKDPSPEAEKTSRFAALFSRRNVMVAGAAVGAVALTAGLLLSPVPVGALALGLAKTALAAVSGIVAIAAVAGAAGVVGAAFLLRRRMKNTSVAPAPEKDCCDGNDHCDKSVSDLDAALKSENSQDETAANDERAIADAALNATTPSVTSLASSRRNSSSAVSEDKVKSTLAPKGKEKVTAQAKLL